MTKYIRSLMHEMCLEHQDKDIKRGIKGRAKSGMKKLTDFFQFQSKPHS